jgi:hypothetical protein
LLCFASSICPIKSFLVDCVLPGRDGGAILSAGVDVPQDAVLPALQRPLRDVGLDASAVAAAAAATARSATTTGSAIANNVNVWFCGECSLCGVWVNLWGMQIDVGMTPKITPKVLLLDLMLELMRTYGKVNNGYNNVIIIRRRIIWAFHWHSWINLEYNRWSLA